MRRHLPPWRRWTMSAWSSVTARTGTVQQALRDSVEAASAARRERIAVVAGRAGETVDSAARAGRGAQQRAGGAGGPGGPTRTANGRPACPWPQRVAGAIAGPERPRPPPGRRGAQRTVRAGAPGMSDNEMDLLVRGGVTPLESAAGVVTRGAGRDHPHHHRRGGGRHLAGADHHPDCGRRDPRACATPCAPSSARAKNTEQSRGAIRSQVVLELENQAGAGDHRRL